MNRRIKQWACGLLMAFIMAVVMPFQMMDSFAATARISFSDPSTTVGETFTVTMKFTCTTGEMLGDTKVMLDYDASLLEFISEGDNPSGGAGKISVRSGLGEATEVVTELRFRALQAGTTAITISDWDGYDNNGQVLTMEREGSSAITIAALPTSSNDANLQMLQISPGTLEPAFSPDVESYTASVGLDVDRLTVSARPNNDNATHSVEGQTELADGENTVTVTVTAEDGTTARTYTILVNKVEGGASEAGTTTTDGDGGEEPAEEPQLEVLAELRSTAKTLRITSLPEGITAPVGFRENSSISIGDVQVTGWTPEGVTNPQYCLFYALNENDEAGFYCYDRNEQTIQRYFAGAEYEEMVTERNRLAESETNLLAMYQRSRYIGFGLMAATGLLAILAVFLLVTRKGNGGRAARTAESARGEEPARTSEPAPTRSRGRKLTKEERYMMGEEETYDDEIPPSKIEDLPAEEDLPPVVEHLELGIESEPAKEAAAAIEDDFEFFDLDEED